MVSVYGEEFDELNNKKKVVMLQKSLMQLRGYKVWDESARKVFLTDIPVRCNLDRRLGRRRLVK
jgi:hypothetical protein